METSSELEVTLVIELGRNYIGNLLRIMLEEWSPTEVRGGVFAGLDEIHKEYQFTEQLSEDILTAVLDGGMLPVPDVPSYPDSEYDETLDYIIGICFKHLEERKLPYEHLSGIRLRYHEGLDRSYVGLVFNVTNIVEVIYGGPCNSYQPPV